MSEIKTCTVNLNNGRQILSCRQGQTLYAALRTKGILLPTGCGARGLCGQCKVTVVQGETDIFTDSEVKIIPEQERAEGRRLGCQLRLLGDLQVAIPDYVFGAKERKVALREVIPLTHDIKRFSFKLAEDDSIPHKAGQFITLVAKIPEPKAQVMRCFSFATPSRVVDRIDCIIKLNPKGAMTPFLFDKAEIGTEFGVIGPYGDFYLRNTRVPCVWIAGGSGLSPFLGMLQDMIDNNIERPVHLFFGATNPGDLYYADLLAEFAKNNPWFRFTPSLDCEERSSVCDEYGRITEVVAKHVGDLSATEGYLCGGPGMIGASVKLLTEKGMARDKIYYDRF